MYAFTGEMSRQEVNKIGVLGLAHIGDAVYELLTRSMLCRDGHSAATELHRLTVSYVNASAQAKAVQRILPFLTEEELSLYKRGRNAHVNSVPHHATVADYHAATGLEALFGWLYLLGRRARIEELYAAIMEGD
ncbi:MAG: ribonuclease III [Oscillospiraceae bacterium]|nr:ribonuclease III [Oscillospiraceae bacterium]